MCAAHAYIKGFKFVDDEEENRSRASALMKLTKALAKKP